MEAGPDSPSIDVPWDGWTNLFWDKSNPALPWQEALALALPEVQLYPELSPILMLLNSLNHFTSKVDVFRVSREEVDPEIAEACSPTAAVGLGSYIDVVNAVPGRFLEFAKFEAIARATAKALTAMSGIPGGAEIVIRSASLGGSASYGWTLYAFGFGADEKEARSAWEQSCRTLAAVFGLEIASANMERSRAILNRSAEQSTQHAGE